MPATRTYAANAASVRTLLGKRGDPALDFMARQLALALREAGASAPLLLWAALPPGAKAADVRRLVPHIVALAERAASGQGDAQQ